MNKSVLLVGATGAVGYYLLHSLSQKNCHVTGLSRYTTQEAVSTNITLLSVDMYDKRQREGCLSGRAFDTVIYGITDPKSGRDVEAVEWICENIAFEQFIFLSSDYVYPSGKEIKFCKEFDEVQGLCDYSKDKLTCENYLRNLYPDKSLILRLSKVLSPRGRGSINALANVLLGSPELPNKLPMFFSGIWIDDVIQFFEKAVECKWTGTVNLAAFSYTLETCSELKGRPLERVSGRVSDTKKACKLMGPDWPRCPTFMRAVELYSERR